MVIPLFHVFYVHLPVVWCENKPISSHNSLVSVVFPAGSKGSFWFNKMAFTSEIHWPNYWCVTSHPFITS